MARKLAPLQLLRRATLGFSLVGLIVITYMHQHFNGIPSVDALCPFGGLETLQKFVAGGEFIRKIEPGNIVLLGGVVALGVILARFFCGWFCAFGALQGLFGWFGMKIFKRRFTVPARLDAGLRWVKYLVLLLIIWFTWRAGELVIRPYDPVAALGHLSAGWNEVWAEFAVGLVVLAASLLLSMLYERAFCKYVCPLGAFIAILGKIRLFRIKRDEHSCISCSLCNRSCPMNILVATSTAVENAECIACLECVTACPTKKNSLPVTLAGKEIKPSAIVLTGFVLVLGAAGIGFATDQFHFAAKPLADLADAGQLSIADIKGSTTYDEAAKVFGVDLERLYRESGVDKNTVPPETRIKDTGALTGDATFETDTVRFAVSRITGIPYLGEDATATGPAFAATVVPAVTPVGAGLVVPPDFVLEGTMSVQDVATALGAGTSAVVQKLNLPVDIPVNQPLRDLKDTYGFSLPALKEAIHGK